MIEAKYYEKLDKDKVRCKLCPVECIIAPDKLGRCLGRKNTDGKLHLLNYGEVVSIANDPMEKKPLYHFHPGKYILSIAPNGCNFLCPFCQNWEISQKKFPTQYISPEDMVKLARRYNSIGIAYTYTEPLIWFDYLLDVCPLIKREGLVNVLVTNGMINEEPLKELLPLIDAMNIDLKSMRDGFYKKVVKGDLEAVKRTIRESKKACHIEVTNLIIPTLNDSKEEIDELIEFVASVGKDTPLHFSRYFPHYKFDIPPTPIQTLKDAYKRAKEKLYYVYLGNVWTDEDHTYCPKCGELLLSRYYLGARIEGIEDKRCKRCGRKVDVVL